MFANCISLVVETHATAEVIFHSVTYFECKRYIEIDTNRSLVFILQGMMVHMKSSLKECQSTHYFTPIKHLGSKSYAFLI